MEIAWNINISSANKDTKEKYHIINYHDVFKVVFINATTMDEATILYNKILNELNTASKS